MRSKNWLKICPVVNQIKKQLFKRRKSSISNCEKNEIITSSMTKENNYLKESYGLD